MMRMLLYIEIVHGALLSVVFAVICPGRQRLASLRPPIDPVAVGTAVLTAGGYAIAIVLARLEWFLILPAFTISILSLAIVNRLKRHGYRGWTP